MPVFTTAGNNPSCAVVGNPVTVVGHVVNSAAVTAAHTSGMGVQPTSCTITVTFTPTAVGTRTGTLTVVSDSSVPSRTQMVRGTTRS